MMTWLGWGNLVRSRDEPETLYSGAQWTRFFFFVLGAGSRLKDQIHEELFKVVKKKKVS